MLLILSNAETGEILLRIENYDGALPAIEDSLVVENMSLSDNASPTQTVAMSAARVVFRQFSIIRGLESVQLGLKPL